VNEAPMRTLSHLRFAALAALLALGAVSTRADGIPFEYDSGSIAAGAAIDSAAQYTASSGDIACFLNNAGASSRVLTINWLADNKTTVLHTETATVLTVTKPSVAISMYSTSAQTGNFAFAIAPSRWMQFQLAAGGAAAGRITCFGR